MADEQISDALLLERIARSEKARAILAVRGPVPMTISEMIDRELLTARAALAKLNPEGSVGEGERVSYEFLREVLSNSERLGQAYSGIGAPDDYVTMSLAAHDDPAVSEVAAKRENHVKRLVEALQRMSHNFNLVLERKPCRDVEEAFAEARSAIAAVEGEKDA